MGSAEEAGSWLAVTESFAQSAGSDRVQTIRVGDHLLAEGLPEAQRRNGHRNTVLGISPADVRLHLAWDHHANALNYNRSGGRLMTG